MESLWQQEDFLLRQPDNFLDTHYTVYSAYFAIENKWGGGGVRKYTLYSIEKTIQ